MRNKSVFILSAALIALGGCTKKTGAYEADGSTTVQTKAPVAGTANDLAGSKTLPGEESGVKAYDSAEDHSFRATSVDPNDPTNKQEDNGFKSGTSTAATPHR